MEQIAQNFEETDGFTVYWRIEGYKLNPDCNSVAFLRSPVFNVKSLKSQWQIKIQQDGKKCLGTYLFLKSKPSSVESIVIKISISLLTANGWYTVLRDASETFSGINDSRGANLTSYSELDRKGWFFLPNGSLTIRFHVWNNAIKNIPSQCVMLSQVIKGVKLNHRPIKLYTNLKMRDFLSFPSINDFDKTMTKDLISLTPEKVEGTNILTDTLEGCESLDKLHRIFQGMELSFVTLRTATKDFSVHKAILCAQSPVFNAMFNTDMLEKSCDVVDIDDIDSETIEIFIKFLHFQPLGDLKWDMVLLLYLAADKYQINSLKTVCVSVMDKHLTVNNICDTFFLADLHQDQSLMKCAQDFFCKNLKLVLSSSKWKDFMCNTELAAKILLNFAETL